MKNPCWLSLTSRAGFWLTVGMIGIRAGCDRAMAQSPAVAPVTPAEESTAVARPGSTLQSYDPTPMSGADGAGGPSADRGFLDDLLTPDLEAAQETGLFDLIRESVFGNRDDLWRPLPLRTFFSEGWSEPWYRYPRSSTGAPRQGWVNSFDGVFYRLYFFSFEYLNDFQKNGNAYSATYYFFAPITRRFQFRFDVPLVASNRGGPGDHYHNNFGNFAVTPRLLLSESQDFTQVFAFMIRTPTGAAVNGNGQTTLIPQYEFWYGGLPRGGVVRGGTGVTIATSGVGGSRTLYDYNLAIGKYWTPHDANLGDLVTYLAINGFTTLDDRGPTYSYLSLTPGFRFHLRNNYFFVAGIEVPMTGPKTASITYAPIFWITKVW